jgi:hypothetical protein
VREPWARQQWSLEEADVVRALSAVPLVPLASFTRALAVPRPAGLRWSQLELVAFVQSVETLEVAAAAEVVLPAGP